MPVTLSSPLNVFGGNTDMTDLIQLTTGATGAINLTATSRTIQLIQTSGATTVTLPRARFRLSFTISSLKRAMSFFRRFV